jgi:NADP-dependent 3-hydroxy acid dehydrogenase YdfG
LVKSEKHEQPLTKKIALVTGGASGIGLACAQRLAGEGARVVIADIQQPETETENIRFKETDITSAAAINELYGWVSQNNLIPDIIISNAGRGITEKLAEGDPEKWHSIFQLNVVGHLRIIRSYLPQMLEKKGSSDILFISSVAARKPHPWGGIYSASKAALQAIAETLRLEVQPKIRVSSILPGVVDTHFFENTIGGKQSVEDMGWGALQPEQIADAAYYILTRPEEVAINELTIRPVAQQF